MNLNQVVNRLSRMLGQRLLRWGMSKGAGGAPAAARAKPGPQQRQREKLGREAAKRARQAARITRKMR